jgi:hypothetical protein
LILEPSADWDETIIIKTCKPGTAGARIQNWRKRLKNSTLLAINGKNITSVQQAINIFSQIPRKTDVKLSIGLTEKLPMHDSHGTPMMYFDQLNTVATHLEQIKNGDIEKKINPSETRHDSPSVLRQTINLLRKFPIGTISKLTGILPKSKIRTKKLTRRKLQQSADWDKWKLSKWKQLDQYYGQKMFGNPCPLPAGANVLNLIWCYDVKTDGTLKARMVCNGRPSNKNTVIFGYTYAKSLDHVGARIFWAAAAAKKLYSSRNRCI